MQLKDLLCFVILKWVALANSSIKNLVFLGAYFQPTLIKKVRSGILSYASLITILDSFSRMNSNVPIEVKSSYVLD